MQLIQLCVNRVKECFPETWVATSISKSDDLLVARLSASDLPVYRGSLNNVLERFCNLCEQENIGENDVVVRLTGDNPIVDGNFLRKMQFVWERNSLEYLAAEPPELDAHGWPKGLSAEFVRAKLLYDSVAVGDSFCNEHVTPYARINSTTSAHMAKFMKMEFEFGNSFGIDTLEDYLFVAGLFEKLPWDAGYRELLELGAK
jgi:spore coat polysaccharide biosynthesis protein SpsF (cytidylyltransferase family)